LTPTAANLSQYGLAGALLSASGAATKLVLLGGTMLTGTVDTTPLTKPESNAGIAGGLVKLTDAGPVTWLVPVSSIIAVGQ